MFYSFLQCSTFPFKVLHFPTMFYISLQCSTIIGIVSDFLDLPKIFYNSLHYSLISHNVLQFYYILQLPQYSTIPYSVLQFPTTFYRVSQKKRSLAICAQVDPT